VETGEGIERLLHPGGLHPYNLSPAHASGGKLAVHNVRRLTASIPLGNYDDSSTLETRPVTFDQATVCPSKNQFISHTPQQSISIAKQAFSHMALKEGALESDIKLRETRT